MEKKTIESGTSVKITKISRALLERAHKDGITAMYNNTLQCPEDDSIWKYFKFCDSEWCRTDTPGTVITVKELENILYPKPQITIQDSIINLINQEIERVGIENVTPLEQALLKTLGIYPPKEIKVYDNGKHVATVTKNKVVLNEGECSTEIIFKLKAAYEKVK